MHMPGDVVELVDTLGLEPSAARRGGSTPSIPTMKYKMKILKLFLFSFSTRYSLALMKEILLKPQ